MGFFSRWKRSARGQEIRREKLIQRLSEEVKANGPESAKAKWITAEIQELDAPPASLVAKGNPTPQRIKASLRANWYAAYGAPTDRTSRMPRKERRRLARAQAKGQYKQQFQHGADRIPAA